MASDDDSGMAWWVNYFSLFTWNGSLLIMVSYLSNLFIYLSINQ